MSLESKKLIGECNTENPIIIRNAMIANAVLTFVGLTWWSMTPLAMATAIVFGLLVIYPRKFSPEFVGVIRPIAFDISAVLSIVSAIGASIIHATGHDRYGEGVVPAVIIFYPIIIANLVVSTIILLKLWRRLKPVEVLPITTTASTPATVLPSSPTPVQPIPVPPAGYVLVPAPAQPTATTVLYPQYQTQQTKV